MYEDDIDFAQLSDPKLTELVTRLSEQERHVSAVRRRLHQRIEFVKSGGAGFDETTNGQLEALEDEERTVSKERHKLHRVLDAALAEQHLRRVERSSDYLDEDPPPPYRNRHRVGDRRDYR
ncbi:MAG: hypothetical protein U0R50_04165 [Gaiellales bacterium]